MLKRRLLAVFVFLGMLALPLLGAIIKAEHPISFYFHFPPAIVTVEPEVIWHALPFFLILPIFYLFLVLFPRCLGFVFSAKIHQPRTSYSSPWWLWFGLVVVVFFWYMAWLPFDSVRFLRYYSFFPLWVGYVLVVDGLVYRRKGHSLISRNVVTFVCLFPVSAVLWWLFEYLNRFIQNWYYVGLVDHTSLGYIAYATPAFATVLPAILETAEYLGSFAWLNRRYKNGKMLYFGKRAAFVSILLGVISLFGLGLWPKYFFVFTWIAPLMILVPLMHIWNPKVSVLTPIAQRGDYRLLIALSLAGPICGFFWEMWNFFSLVRWEYQIPFVHFAKIFAMPLIGYFGYVPFGWECLLIWNIAVLILGYAGDGLEVISEE